LAKGSPGSPPGYESRQGAGRVDAGKGAGRGPVVAPRRTGGVRRGWAYEDPMRGLSLGDRQGGKTRAEGRAGSGEQGHRVDERDPALTYFRNFFNRSRI